MFVYHLCYCLQSLLLLLRKNQSFSSPKTSQPSVWKTYRPLLVFYISLLGIIRTLIIPCYAPEPSLQSVAAPVYIYTCILSKVFCTSPDLPLTPGGGWRMSKSSSSNLWSPDVSGVALQPPQSTEKAVEEEQSVSAIDPFTSCNSYRWNVRVQGWDESHRGVPVANHVPSQCYRYNYPLILLSANMCLYNHVNNIDLSLNNHVFTRHAKL